MELFDVYVDNGYSGANFDRPEFKRMMSDIETGNANCVIVKDLSRSGRDYIEAGRLIQKTFPAFHVRFIAVLFEGGRTLFRARTCGKTFQKHNLHEIDRKKYYSS